jgi:hypothetical protein
MGDGDGKTLHVESWSQDGEGDHVDKIENGPQPKFVEGPKMC